MKKANSALLYASLGLILIFVQGCDFDVTYDITVINDTNFSFSIYLDDVLQFKLASGGVSTIKNVDSGSHALEARTGSDIVAERFVNLNSDLEWTVYMETYELTVCNDTDQYFSFYLDGVFQSEVEAGECMIFTDVSAEVHTLEAKDGNYVIADETFEIDKDTEWSVY